MFKMTGNDHGQPLHVGYELEGYKITDVLGVGGFGVTYLAEEAALGRRVAIKEYVPIGIAERQRGSAVRAAQDAARADFDWGLARFRQEGRTLVAFDHPNIVRVHRFFEANGTAYLVMQLVEGESLARVLARRHVLSEEEIRRFIAPLLDGLEDVHRAGFLHRDIKPGNILLRLDGTPVLIDFGAARQALVQRATTGLTTVLSDGYAPHEQYDSRGHQGPWTDIYGVGAVLYRCVAGMKPIRAPDRIAARLRGVPDPLPPAARLNGYTPRLLAAVDAAMAVIESERPATIADWRAMLIEPARMPHRVPTREANAPGPPAISVPSEQTLVAGAARPQRSSRRYAWTWLTAALLAISGVAIGVPRLVPPPVRTAPPAVPDVVATEAPKIDEAPRDSDKAAPVDDGAEEQHRRDQAERLAASAALLVREAGAAMARGEWRAAYEHLGAAERLAPDDAGVSALRATIVGEAARRVARADEAADRRDWDEAQRHVASAAQSFPDLPLVAAGRERVARAVAAWERSRPKYLSDAQQAMSEAEAAIDGFAWEKARDRIGDAEEALMGFARDLPLRGRLAALKRKLRYAQDDIRYERLRIADEERYLADRARADAAFATAQREWHERGHHERACVQYRDAAELGHVAAQNQFGLCFAIGRGMMRDATEAYFWFRRSAEGGNAVGQFNLAGAYADGSGTERDYERALRWAQRAAAQDFPRAFCRVGLLHREGHGIEENKAEAVSWFRRGAEAGEAWCMTLLGEAYEHGWGLDPDKSLARQWYERAAKKGYEPAKRKLAELN